MKKAKVLKVVNLLLFIVFVFQASTGIGHSYIDDGLFSVIHKTGGLLLLVFAVTHLVLNWGWIKQNYLKVKGEG
jgi:hypothetical protein